jgi:hypothetical protein
MCLNTKPFPKEKTMKRALILLLTSVILVFGAFALSCNEDPDDGDTSQNGDDGYSVTFKVDGEVYQILQLPTEGALTFPDVPSKVGHIFKGWFEGETPVTEITADAGRNIELSAKFDLITYTVTFVADGVTVDTCDFNVQTSYLNPPGVPVKKGYNGAWEAFTLGTENITVNAVYTPTVYTATFVADGNTVAVKEFTVENMTFDIPAVPEKAGHFGMWEFYVIDTESIVIHAIYTVGDYVVTFMNGDTVIGEVGYTFGDTSVTEPSVPFRQCYTGKWQDYTLSDRNITVKAEYTLSHTALIRVDAVSPKCNATGNIEYWSCYGCDKYFSDQGGTQQIINKSSVILSNVPCSFNECVCIWCGAKDHELTHHAKVEPKCNAAGVYEHWSCSKCNKNFSDQACSSVLSSVSIPTVPCQYSNLICIWCQSPATNAYQITYTANGGTVNGSENGTYSIAKTYDQNFLLQQTLHINNGAATFKRSGYQLIGYSTSPTTEYANYTSVNAITGFSNVGGVCEVPRSTNKLTLYPVWAKETATGSFASKTVTYNDIFYAGSTNTLGAVVKRDTTGIEITSYSGSHETVVIPEYINGSPVIGIAANAFSSTSVKKIVIPQTVKKIASGAFSKCTGLTELVFFDSLQYVYNESFPSTVKTIVMNSTKLPTYAGSAEGSFCIKYERVRFYRNSKKMIVVSGSSTLNGLNSQLLYDNFNGEYEIVNYGTNAGTQSMFYLDVISKYTTTGDIVIHAPEWTSGNSMGDNKLQWKIFRGNNQCYDIFRDVDMSKYTNFWGAYTDCHIGKLINSKNTESDWAGLNTGKEYQHPNTGMNKYGDLVGNRNKRTYDPGNTSMIFSNGQLSSTRAANLNYVNSKIVSKGGTLLFSFGTADALKVTKASSSWRNSCDSFTRHCASLLDFPVISNVGTYIMGSNDMNTTASYQEIYNSEWHCTYYGANVRTVELTYDIKQYLNKRTDSWESYTTRESHRNTNAYKTYNYDDWN